ncbi:MAG: hypothetical protein L3K24_16925, partial [Gammaproteobacteria bacterium]|nr:hypothetical protein [Gammaproteobacteria bacterium]
GLGTVSKDGSIIETNPGVGVIKAGWHCGSQPGGSGCCDGGGGGGCGYCYDASPDCNNTNCTFKPERPLQNQSPTDCKTLKCSGWDPANETPSTPDTPKDCKKPVCENGSPTQIADAGDKPDDIPNDCKKPACDGMNPTTEDDDNDWPPPNDNDAKCKKCQDGSPIADPSKNADGVNYQCSDADSCFVCQSGSCSRKPDIEHDTIVPVGVNVSQLINILNGATSGVRSICAVAADPSINGEISGTLVERCCEGDFNNAARLNGSVSWQQPAIQCRIPTPLSLGGVVTIGVAVNLGGSAQITGSGIFADCDCSYNVSLAGNLRLEAGVALIIARLDPSVFDVTGVGSAVAQVSGSLDCNGLNYNGGQLGPLQIIFRVTFGNLLTKEYQHTFNDLSWNF